MTFNANSAIDLTNEGSFAKAISVFADSARADASLIISSGLTGSDSRVTDAGEGFTGVIRWLSYSDGATPAKPNVNGLDGDFTEFMTASNQAETYVKNSGVTGARENSVQSLISKVDGLAYLGRQFGAARARREDANLRAILTGVGARVWDEETTVSGATTSAAYLTALPTAVSAADTVGKTLDGTEQKFGYYTGSRDSDTAAGYQHEFIPLFENESTANNRSAFFDVLLDAMTAVSGEFEEPFYYLVVTPGTFNILRKQNVLDVNPIQDGNLNINTLLGGKIRLIVSGNATATVTGLTGLNTSYLMKGAAFHYSNVAVNNPTAIDNSPLSNRGFGDVSIVSRWSNIIHPKGYSWAAATTTQFPADSVLDNAGSWATVATNVNQTGIFPIFHG